MAKLSVKIEAVTKGLSAKLASAKGAFKKFGGSVKSIGVGVLGFGTAIAGAVFSIGKMAGQLTQTKIAMETFLGSAEKAKQLIGDLRQFADVTPFDTNSVIQAGKVLAGAGVEAEGVVDVVKMLGDISAGTGKDLGEMAQLYAKSMNKGKIQTRELLQLVNAGVPIVDKLKDALGVRTKEAIFKMAEQGRLKFKDLNQTFKEMTSSGGIYAGLMDKQSRTFIGRLSTLQGKLQNLATDVGGPLQNSLTSITDTFINWTAQARNMRGPLGLLIKDLGVVADLLETTRDKGSLAKTTGLKDYGTVDLITDSIDKMLGTSFGGFLGTGAQQIGKSQGLNGGMSQERSDMLDKLDRIAEASEGTKQNTSKQGFN
jgi:tape measure domain-containing protein